MNTSFINTFFIFTITFSNTRLTLPRAITLFIILIAITINIIFISTSISFLLAFTIWTFIKSQLKAFQLVLILAWEEHVPSQGVSSRVKTTSFYIITIIGWLFYTSLCHSYTWGLYFCCEYTIFWNCSELFHMYFLLLLMYMLYLFRLKYIPISSHMLNLNYIMILSLLYRYLHIILGILRLGILLFFSFFYFFNVILFF